MPHSRTSPRRPFPESISPTSGSTPFDLGVLFLFFVSLAGMVVFFGGSVFWSSGPFFLLALLAATACNVRTLRQEGPSLQLYPPPGTCAWGLLLAMAFVRAILNPRIPYQAWTEVMQLAAVLIFYVAIADLANRRKVWRWLLAAFLLLVAVQAMYALSLHWHGSNKVLWTLRPEGYGQRASGTFICPNHYAQLLQVGMVLAMGLLATPAVGVPLRLVAGYALLASLPAIFLTASRSGWLGLIAGAVALGVLKALRRGWKATVAVLATLSVVLSLSTWALWMASPMFRNRVATAKQGDIRWTAFWPDTWRMIEGEGFWGAGPGVFQHVFDKYRLHFDHPSLYLRYAHNEFLHLIADYGWLGLGVVLLGLGHVFWVLLKVTFRQTNEAQAMIPMTMLAILAASAVHAVFDFTAHMPGNMMALSLVMATLYGHGLQRGIWEQKPIQAWRAKILVGATAVVAPLLAVAFVPLALGDWAEYNLEGARNAENHREELMRARDMQRWTPIHWRGWREEALHHRREAFWTVEPELRNKRADRSRELYAKALRWNPYDRISLLGLVQLEMREERYEAAIPRLEELALLDPLDAHTRVQLGLALRHAGRLEEALAAFQTARKLRGVADRQIDLNIAYLQGLSRAADAPKPD